MHTAEYAYDVYRFERIYRNDVDKLLKANMDEIEKVINWSNSKFLGL